MVRSAEFAGQPEREFVRGTPAQFRTQEQQPAIAHDQGSECLESTGAARHRRRDRLK